MARKKALPKKQGIPAGMSAIEHADSWNPDAEGDSIHFRVTSAVKEIPFRDGPRRVVEVTTMDGRVLALWENAALRALFANIERDGLGGEYFVQYDGLGEAKLPGQSPPKLFTVAGRSATSGKPF